MPRNQNQLDSEFCWWTSSKSERVWLFDEVALWGKIQGKEKSRNLKNKTDECRIVNPALPSQRKYKTREKFVRHAAKAKNVNNKVQ